jgi:hypothetical protein
MDNVLDILKDMAKAALKLHAAIEWADTHPDDPWASADIDYSRDFVINTIHRLQTIEGYSISSP